MNNSLSNGSYLDLCETAFYLSEHSWLKIMIFVRLFTAVIGIVFFAVLFRIQGTYLAFHENARILLISHHIWAIMQCVTNIGAQSFDLYRNEMNDADDEVDPCTYMVSTIVAVLVRGPHMFAQHGQVFAIATMAIERGAATIWCETYEAANGTLGKLIVIFQWILASLSLLLAIEDLDWSEMKPFATVSSSRTSKIFVSLLIGIAVIEVVTILVFYGLLWYNRRRKAKCSYTALTERYQIEENIRSIRLMIPMIWTHFCCFIPTFVAFPFYIKFINPTLAPRDYIIFTSTFNFIPFYPVILPIILLWRHETLRKSLKNLRKSVRNNNRVSPGLTRVDGRTEEQILHFEALKIMWTPKVYDREIRSSRERQIVDNENVQSITAN